MKLSEMETMLAKLKSFAAEHGEQDPDISFWSDLSDDVTDVMVPVLPEDISDVTCGHSNLDVTKMSIRLVVQ